MRVGVFIEQTSPEGGKSVFIDTIVNAIRRAATHHEFIFIDDIKLESVQAKRSRTEKAAAYEKKRAKWEAEESSSRAKALSMLGLRKPQPMPAPPPPPPASLDDRIRKESLDLVWFLGPRSQPSIAPYFATVLDLAHRSQPWFPEVNGTGWTWEQREDSYRSSLPRAARVIIGAEAGKAEVVRYYSVLPDNVAVVPLPVPEFEATKSTPDIVQKFGLQRPFVFYPAQYWPHKNHANLLHAVKYLRDTLGLDVDLVLTGADKGNADYVSATITALGLSEHVHRLGFVQRGELAALYRQAIALVYPSFFGPDNLPPLEALSLGTAVAVARIDGAEEQLGDAALYFDPCDPVDMANAVARLHADASLRSSLVQRGQRILSERSGDLYVASICGLIDAFAPLRRTWGREYATPKQKVDAGTAAKPNPHG